MAGIVLLGVLVPTLLGAPLAMLLTILAGVLAAYHLLRLVGVTTLVAILAAAYLLAGAVVVATLLTILAGVLAALAAYLLTGLVVEWLIDRRLFRSDSSHRRKRPDARVESRMRKSRTTSSARHILCSACPCMRR